MAYTSEFALALTENGSKELEDVLSRCSFADDVRKLLGEKVKDSSGAILYRGSGVKWHDGLPEVDLVCDFMDGSDDEDYCFVRIGDQIDDMVEMGDFNDNPWGLCVTRSIQVNV